MIRAVVFDLGGVVLDSPFDVIAELESSGGLVPGFLTRIAGAPNGAWGLHETGQIDRAEFISRFAQECRVEGGDLDVGQLLDDIEAYAKPRPRMVEAIARLKEGGFLVAALTNNWESPTADWEVAAFQQLFDVFVESWVEGIRKPDPGIYRVLLERLAVPAGDCVFLDDIGRNLKTARHLGMSTIKVSDPDAALADLGTMLGVDL